MQELKENTYNLTRMNLVMRGILPDNIVTRNGDTLEEDWPYFDENDPIHSYNPLCLDGPLRKNGYVENLNASLVENCWIVKSLTTWSICKQDWNNGDGNTTKSDLTPPVATTLPAFMLDKINPQH